MNMSRISEALAITPFDLRLDHELNREALRFANEWLFPWHNINIENRVVKVDDFQGRFIQVGGIVFDGQIRKIYWQAIQRYLLIKIHDAFKAWDTETGQYPPSMRAASLEWMSNRLTGFVGAIIARSINMDRALRGRGDPESVNAYDTSHEQGRANAEIMQLVQSHKALDVAYAANSLRDAVSPKFRLFGFEIDYVKAWAWVRRKLSK